MVGLDSYLTLQVPVVSIYIYIYMIIAVRVNAPALEGARPSAGTVLTEKLNMFPSIFLWLSMISYHIYGLDDIIQNI